MLSRTLPFFLFLFESFFYDGEVNTLRQVSVCQLSLTLVSFKAIISNLMYGEFDRGTCAPSDIYAAMLHVSLSVGWLAHLEVGGASWICARGQVETVGGSTSSVNSA